MARIKLTLRLRFGPLVNKAILQLHNRALLCVAASGGAESLLCEVKYFLTVLIM